MSIDEEMKLWEVRSNDEFGSILKQIRQMTSDIVIDTVDAMNQYIAIYSLDGESARKRIANSVENFLINYDLTGSDYKEFDNLVKKLKKLV